MVWSPTPQPASRKSDPGFGLMTDRIRSSARRRPGSAAGHRGRWLPICRVEQVVRRVLWKEAVPWKSTPRTGFDDPPIWLSLRVSPQTELSHHSSMLNRPTHYRIRPKRPPLRIDLELYERSCQPLCVTLDVKF